MSAILLKSLVPGTLFSDTGTALVPASNRQVFVYLRDTSTQVAVYTSEALTTLLTQPLVSDIAGGVPGYIASKQAVDFYDVVTQTRLPAESISVGDIQTPINTANTTGLTSAQIDSTFAATPSDGTLISDPTNHLFLIRQNGKWCKTALTVIA